MNYRDIINKLKSLRKESVEFIEENVILYDEELRKIIKEYYSSKFKNRALGIVKISFNDNEFECSYWPCVVSYEHKDDEVFEIVLDKMCKSNIKIYLEIINKVPSYIHLMSIKELNDMFLKYGYYNINSITYQNGISVNVTKKLIKGKGRVIE